MTHAEEVFLFISPILWLLGLWTFGSQTDRIIEVLESIAKSAAVFVQKMDETELDSETEEKLRAWSGRDMHVISEDPVESYNRGLEDGVTMTAQFVLGGRMSDEPSLAEIQEYIGDTEEILDHYGVDPDEFTKAGTSSERELKSGGTFRCARKIRADMT